MSQNNSADPIVPKVPKQKPILATEPIEPIELTKIKCPDLPKKKVISTCFFVPQEATVSQKMFLYITGLIKSVETFKARMPGWKYRIYYDSMFDEGIDLSNYQSTYNNKSIYDLKPNTNTPYNIKVKTNVADNKEILKKYLKLTKLYLEKLKTDDPKYDFVELISYNYPRLRQKGYIGHPSTFGSIIRFYVMFDPDVDIFFLVNSSHAISPYLASHILEWESNPQKKYLCQDSTFGYDWRNLSYGLTTEFSKIKKLYQSPLSFSQRILASLFGMKKVVVQADIKQKFELLLSKLDDYSYGIDELILTEILVPVDIAEPQTDIQYLPMSTEGELNSKKVMEKIIKEQFLYIKEELKTQIGGKPLPKPLPNSVINLNSNSNSNNNSEPSIPELNHNINRKNPEQYRIMENIFKKNKSEHYHFSYDFTNFKDDNQTKITNIVDYSKLILKLLEGYHRLISSKYLENLIPTLLPEMPYLTSYFCSFDEEKPLILYDSRLVGGDLYLYLLLIMYVFPNEYYCKYYDFDKEEVTGLLDNIIIHYAAITEIPTAEVSAAPAAPAAAPAAAPPAAPAAAAAAAPATSATAATAAAAAEAATPGKGGYIISSRKYRTSKNKKSKKSKKNKKNKKSKKRKNRKKHRRITQCKRK